MIRSVSLWHVTPADIGVEFFDPTDTVLTSDEKLYQLVNDPSIPVDKTDYSKKDYKAIAFMRSFLQKVKTAGEGQVHFVPDFPGIIGCIGKFAVTERINCYIMVSGIVVFYERGESIPIEDEAYFSLPAFYERQVYEDDYCCNPDTTPRKKPLYDFLKLLWRCAEDRKYIHSATDKFGNNGIEYTLCITMIDDPDLVSNKLSDQMKKNMRALLDTSAFSNVLHENQWGLIRQRIDNDDFSDLKLKELSETLVFADNWSGVLLAGDLTNNDMCIKWLMEFEIFLQSQWLLFDAYCENIARTDMSPIELQEILNRVEYVKVKLDNDISSNMEQSRHVMRNSLIESSDINTIYQKMHGMLTNKLKLKIMANDKKKSHFALFTDLSLLVIAVMQIYSVVAELLAKESLGKTDIISLAIITLITVISAWAMIKGRQ